MFYFRSLSYSDLDIRKHRLIVRMNKLTNLFVRSINTQVNLYGSYLSKGSQTPDHFSSQGGEGATQLFLDWGGSSLKMLLQRV